MRCVLCGVQSFRFAVVATTLFDGKEALGNLCAECVKAGPVLVGDRIRQHAADVREQARRLDALADDLSKGGLARWSTWEEATLASYAALRELGMEEG